MSTTHSHSKAQKIAYDSNPFTAGWAGVVKIFTINPQTFVGMVVCMFGLFAALSVAAILALLATVPFAARHFTDMGGWSLPQHTDLNFFATMSDGGIYVTWGICLAVALVAIALLQALQLRFAISTARKVSISFKKLFGPSFQFVLPLLGLSALLILAVLVAAVSMGLLSIVAPLLAYLLLLIVIFGGIYLALRVSLASYAIVDRQLGPIAALKHSWRVTNGRVLDVIGTGAATWLLYGVPGIVLGALARLSENAPMLVNTFDVLGLVLEAALIIVAALPMAERFVQLQAVYDKEAEVTPVSPFNFLAILLFIILSPVLNALTAQDASEPYNTFNLPALEQRNTTPQGSTNAY